MQRLAQAAAFVWQYYGVYAWVFITGLTTVFACRRLPRLRACTTACRAFLYPLLAVECCLLSRSLLKLSLWGLLGGIPFAGAVQILIKIVLAVLLTTAAVQATAMLCALAERIRGGPGGGTRGAAARLPCWLCALRSRGRTFWTPGWRPGMQRIIPWALARAS